MSNKKFAYILPNHLDHLGINIKVNGQINTLKKHYDTKWVHLQANRKAPWVIKMIDYIRFHVRASFELLRCPVIYMRYNPKVPFIMIGSIGLSYFKRIYIEHNMKMDNELEFLGRKSEQLLHRGCLFFLKWGKHVHIAVSEEIKQTLLAAHFSEKQVVYCQNGYSPPTIVDAPDQSIIDTVKKWRPNYEKIAIFTGNGYPWHGVEDVQKILERFPQIGMIVVGPYEVPKTIHTQWLYTGKLKTSTLFALYEIADFAIGTFRWDMLNVTQGSPLKSREYLAHGLPMLVNYYDGAEDFDELKPFIFNYQNQKEEALKAILKHQSNKTHIKQTALRLLSWENVWRNSTIIL